MPVDISTAWRQTPSALHIHAHMQQRDVACVIEPRLHAGVVQPHVTDAIAEPREALALPASPAPACRNWPGLLSASNSPNASWPDRRADSSSSQPTEPHRSSCSDRRGPGRQLGHPQHAKRIEPDGTGNDFIVGKAGTSRQGVHAASPVPISQDYIPGSLAGAGRQGYP